MDIRLAAVVFKKNCTGAGFSKLTEMVKLACSIGNKVCIHGDDTVITGILCFQNLNDLIFDQLRIFDFIRNDRSKIRLI